MSDEDGNTPAIPDQAYVKSTKADVARDLIRTESFAEADKALARTIQWMVGLPARGRDRLQAFWGLFDRKLKAKGVDPNAIPERVGIPVLQAAALEEREEIRELWANLLVSAATGEDVDEFHIGLVKQLSPDAARLLAQVAEVSIEKGAEIYALRKGGRLHMLDFFGCARDLNPALERLRMALSRLEALGLVHAISVRKTRVVDNPGAANTVVSSSAPIFHLSAVGADLLDRVTPDEFVSSDDEG